MSVSVGTISAETISSGRVTGPDFGPELQVNWDMGQGVAAWTESGSTVSALTDMGRDAVLLTSIDGAFDRGELAISGLEIGKTYRFKSEARQGVQGVFQAFGQFTWGTIIDVFVTSGVYSFYEFDVVATATSGASRCYSSRTGAGAAGDELYISSVSIKEVL